MQSSKFVKLIIIAALLLVGIAPVHAQQQPINSITVVGEGRVSAAPDLASVTLGVEVLNTDLAQAIMDVETRMSSITDAITALGVDPLDVQIVGVNVVPQDLIDTRTGALTGQLVYRVSNVGQIILRDMTQSRQIISEGVQAGANVIRDFTLGAVNMAALETAARTSAITSAYERAGELASGLGLIVGEPLEVEEVAITRGVSAPDIQALEGRAGQLIVTVEIRVTFRARVGG